MKVEPTFGIRKSLAHLKMLSGMSAGNDSSEHFCGLERVVFETV